MARCIKTEKILLHAMIAFTYLNSALAFDCTGLEYVCQESNTIQMDTNTDYSACILECPQCLVGPEWEARLASLGTGTVNRTVSPRVYYNDWLSIEVVSTIFTMLAKETMNFPMRSYNDPNAGSSSLLCCDDFNVYLEAWPTTSVMDTDPDYHKLTDLAIGYGGQSNLYVLPKTLVNYPMATAWNSYKFLPEYSHMFRRAFSTPCEDIELNTSLGCVEDNYACSEIPTTWLDGGGPPCQEGRYVPPQCNGPSRSKYCQEILFPNPGSDPGFFESLINNTGLNFTFVYVNPIGPVFENYIYNITYNSSENVIFYWWQPDPFTARLNAQPITFPPPTPECTAATTDSPLTNGNTCGYPVSVLKKLALSSRLAQDTDFSTFFSSFVITDSQIDGLMRDHVQGGGTMDTWNASCNWIKNNYNTWSSWVHNRPQSVAAVTVSSSGGVNAGMVAGIVIAVAFVIALPVAVKYIQNAHRVYRLLNNDKVATEIAESVAAMDFEKVKYLDGISQPTRIQNAFIKIVKRLQVYKAYMPATLFAAGECDDDLSDVEHKAVVNNSDAVQAMENSHSRSSLEKSPMKKPDNPMVPSGLHHGDSPRGSSKHSRDTAVSCLLNVSLSMSKRNVTVVYVSMRGFLEAAKEMPMDSTVHLHSAYIDAVVGIAQATRGVPDTFVGDRVVVTYNAVLPNAQHRITGCRGALQIVGAPSHWPATTPRRPLSCGVASGLMTCGNMGGASMRRFTLVSPLVGLAWVLCRTADLFSVDVLFPDYMNHEVEHQFETCIAVRQVQYRKFSANAMSVRRLITERQAAVQEEWLYEIGQEGSTPLRTFSAAVRALHEDDLAKAQALLEGNEEVWWGVVGEEVEQLKSALKAGVPTVNMMLPNESI